VYSVINSWTVFGAGASQQVCSEPAEENASSGSNQTCSN